MGCGMSVQSKVELATLEDADWTFTENAKVMRCVKNAAIKAANEFEMVEFEDAHQDALLWLSVRPEQVAAVLLTEDFTSFTQNIYANALRPAAVRESDRYAGTVWLDSLDREAGES